MANSEADPGSRQTRADVLRSLGVHGPMSRNVLARTLGVSPATITGLTRELLELGLLRNVGKRPSSGGRPAELLELVADSGHLLGAKVASDRVVGVITDLSGEIVDSFEFEFNARSVDPISELELSLRDRFGLEPSRLLGVGLGVPGMVNSAEGGRVTAPTLGWSDLPLGSELQSRLGLPVMVENDVHTLAVAEQLFGQGRDVDDFVTITLGAGVGMGLVVSGELVTGARGGAGELGHVMAVEDGPVCTCGRHGCLESVASEPSLLRKAGEGGLVDAGATIADLRQLASTDPEVSAIFATAGTHLGRAVATVVTLLAPEMVLVSGEGVASWPLLKDAFAEAFASSVVEGMPEVPVVVDHWDDLDWARGAASLLARTVFAPSSSDGTVERLVRTRLAETAQQRSAANDR